MSSSGDVPAVNLYLIGFMGVGKSAVGRGVARTLGYRFIDSDRAIEKQQGRKISDIFKSEGETAFRGMERDFLERGHPPRRCVVACGGGLVVAPGMRELLLSKGIVVCLFASEKTILERTSKNNRRPLLNVPDPEAKIRRLLNERLPIYQKTGTGICAEHRSISEIVGHVTRVYRYEQKNWAPQSGRVT